jgi:ubiquinone/menaquinone biosynthesis C-methylase UbiE
MEPRMPDPHGRFPEVIPEEKTGTDDLITAKRRFYSDAEVARRYDRLRFGGRSGRYVNQREIALVERLLPAGRRIVDVGAGTGRIGLALARRGDTVVSCDPSEAMLRQATAHGLKHEVQGDGFALPFVDGAFQGAVALRLLFHFANVRPLLGEIRRVVRLGGTLVCDTYAWSARALLPLQAARWGPAVYAVRSRSFAARAAASGWAVRQVVPCFLTSPYVYQLLPERASLRLERWEQRVPRRLLARRFWALTAV